jgi:hypothetical protein
MKLLLLLPSFIAAVPWIQNLSWTLDWHFVWRCQLRIKPAKHKTTPIMKLPGEFSVHYDTRNHWSVITQMHGSVWPFVWKYCAFNLVVMLVDFFVLDDLFAKYGITITDKGHTISIFFVAFFCVSRANMALARYNTARSNLGTMMSATRELVAAVVSSLLVLVLYRVVC